MVSDVSVVMEGIGFKQTVNTQSIMERIWHIDIGASIPHNFLPPHPIRAVHHCDTFPLSVCAPEWKNIVKEDIGFKPGICNP